MIQFCKITEKEINWNTWDLASTLKECRIQTGEEISGHVITSQT